VRLHGSSLSLGEIKRMELDEVGRLFHSSSDQLLSREELRLIQELDVSIQRIEKHVLQRARKMPEYDCLLSIPGIGQILGMTIALETGDPARFASAGDFASYCRAVRSERSSNGKKKGENNTKCGNKYLAWAFVEAANFAQRYDPQAQAFYARKKAQTNTMVATKALACKLAKAAWHIMTKKTSYDGKRVFGGSDAATKAEGCAGGGRVVSFSRETEVEREGKNKPADDGNATASPVESSQLSDQAALGLRPRGALSSAGKKKSKAAAKAAKAGKEKSEQTMRT
jgi:hypothetical protein